MQLSNTQIVVGAQRVRGDGSYDYETIISETRNLVSNMVVDQRFEPLFKKAKGHLMDALQYKQPRPQTQDENISRIFRVVYKVQTSYFWSLFLFLLSYLFMYLVMLNYQEHYIPKIALQWAILAILWIDVGMEIYQKSFHRMRGKSRFHCRFYVRVLVLTVLVIEESIFVAMFAGGRPLRPFKILRGILPIFYDHFLRKSLAAVLGSLKDIIVFLLFYGILIVTFALVTNQFIQIPEGVHFDQYSQNYGHLGSCLFLTYVLGTYDSFPDNQTVANAQSLWNYGFFILFALLNIFFFTVIPATIIFNSFRDTRSKILIVQQLKQKHSLILCFVTLEDANNSISIYRLIEFLLYIYKKKPRYVDYIAQICLELDRNNNKSIQVNEFSQLCKILQSNTDMMPPKIKDWECWVNFRNWANENHRLETIVKGKIFNIIDVIVVILAFANGILVIILNLQALLIVDTIFTVAFLLLILFRFLAAGSSKFFLSKFNKVELTLVLIALVLECLPRELIPRNADVLIKMFRIYRVSVLVDMTRFKSNTLYLKLRQLFEQTGIVLPIVMKFFPMILIFFYIFGVIGMEFFLEQNATPSASDNPYSTYADHSNFNWFLGSQFIMVQVLTEASWSILAFDQAFRKPQFYGLIIAYFVICHIGIVLIIANLLKGLVWEVYSTVHEEYNARRIKFETKCKKQQTVRKLREQKQQIKKTEPSELKLDTILKKKLCENILNEEAMRILKENLLPQNNEVTPLRHNTMNLINAEVSPSRQRLCQTVSARKRESQKYREMEDIFRSKVVRQHPPKKVLNSQALDRFLQGKLKEPSNNPERQMRSTIGHNIANENSFGNVVISEINSLLHIQKSQKDQRIDILDHMFLKNYISLDEFKKFQIQPSEYDASQSIHISAVIRSTFLGMTNQDLVKKFETQYFSNLYGRSYKQINKLALQPLLRYEASLTYSFRNLIRYPNIRQEQFFTILRQIESKISNKLLKAGSLFKFVYELDNFPGNWFSIELDESRELKIHFLKSGRWVYFPTMRNATVYYADDIFNWNFNQDVDKASCHDSIKRFYQSFQSLAFSLEDPQVFFTADPTNFLYDLYTFFLNVAEIPRTAPEKSGDAKISKIMMVILSKEHQREARDSLPYDQLTTFVADPKMQERGRDYNISQNQTFEKLKSLSILDHQKIIESEGLPYQFILNLMAEISQNLTINSKNFVEQVEKVFNSQFNPTKYL